MTQQELSSLISEILEKGYLMSLATQDEQGLWVSDVIYVHTEDFKLYWISDPEVRHSKAIEKYPHVAGTITVSNLRGEENIGIQFSGEARLVEGDDLALGAQHRGKRGRPAPQKEGEILEDGERWYMLTPDVIDVVYEPLFGFEKKTWQRAS